jgi:hypothetical protein
MIWEGRIQHSYRKVNKRADFLANFSCDSDGPLIIYQSCSTQLRFLLEGDI